MSPDGLTVSPASASHTAGTTPVSAIENIELAMTAPEDCVRLLWRYRDRRPQALLVGISGALKGFAIAPGRNAFPGIAVVWSFHRPFVQETRTREAENDAMEILIDRPAAATTELDEHESANICLHLNEAAQLFDSLDPYPFHERDLDADAEEYIVASAQELSRRPAGILVYLDRSSGDASEARKLEQAIHEHFARKLQMASRELRNLLHRGWISLLIGLAFLGALLASSEAVAQQLTPGPLASVLSESLVIGGWVALWRPLEIFLYDWWPIVGQRRTYALLSRLPVSVVPGREFGDHS
jgi:hypothetical protein